MKRVGNLYHRIIDTDNIRLAHMAAKRGKRHYSAVKIIDSDPEKYFNLLHKILLDGGYRTSPYNIITRRIGAKTRVIYKLPYFPDRIMHHCIMNVVEPVWESVLIRDTYSSIKGRGIHDGVNRVKAFLNDQPGTKYCLKIDIRKFYPSIDHAILKDIIRRKIKCQKTLSLLDEIVDSAPGVPIGNYLSQYFGNLYLAYFDHWCKEELCIRYYARYCDDIVIFGQDKTMLHGLFSTISNYLHRHLRLSINDNYQVFPTRVRGVDFLGYRFFGGYTLVRESIAKQFKRRVAKIRSGQSKMSKLQQTSSLMSYKGWFRHGDAHRLWERNVANLKGRVNYI